MDTQKIINLFNHPLDLMVLMKFGSHLYGTATETSDQDFKGVFLPTIQDALLGKIPKAYHYNSKKGNEERNTEEDIDVEIYSLHYFIELACQGQTVALDMVHAPGDCLLIDTPRWQELTAQKTRFYTSNIKAFVGYAQKQAAKYGIKGSRMNAIKTVIDFFKQIKCQVREPEEFRLQDIWDRLPMGDHIAKWHGDPDLYEICGKQFHATVKINHILPILETIYDNYGKRAQQAANNEGIDWKAVSHALRAALEVKEILTDSTITFPLKQAKMLKSIKQGKEDWNHIQRILEYEIDQVKKLAEESTLPKKADRKFWNQFIVNIMSQSWFLSTG